jgi:hypothetical protein
MITFFCLRYSARLVDDFKEGLSRQVQFKTRVDRRNAIELPAM